MVRRLATVLALVLLTACASTAPEPSADDLSGNAWARASSPDGLVRETWAHQTFPGKRPSIYRHERKEGRETMKVLASSSVSMVRQVRRIEVAELGQLQFSWLVPQLMASADMEQRDFDDSPVRLVLAFDGDRSRLNAKDRVLSELAEALTGEPLPYATLMYVWCNQRPVDSVIVNPRTSRIRKLVMESGAAQLSRWLEYQRDVRADYIKAFGEEPGALLAIGIMTDSDNTGSKVQAWYGPVRHQPASVRPAAALRE